MKKTSTLALSLLLAAGAWCGLAYAADADTTPETGSSEAQTATFDFHENQYGKQFTSDGNFYETTAMTGTEGDITMTVTGKYRLWSNGEELRLYIASKDDETAAKLDFKAEEGTITKITFTGKSLTNISLPEGAEGKYENGEWTGSAKNVVFDTNKSSANIKTITVTYTGGKAPVELETPLWRESTLNQKEAYTAVMGTQYVNIPGFYAYLESDPYKHIPVENTSSNTEVATIDEYGQITLVAPGVTTISGTVKATDTYSGISKSYKLTVLPEGTVYYSAMGEDFTFENPEGVEVWKHNEKYGLVANAQIDKVNNEATVMAVSPEITLKENYGVELNFDEAINYLGENPVGEHMKVYVGTLEESGDEPDDPDNPDNPDDPGQDGISEIGLQGAASAIYDLQGRRVSNPSNGIFIINGKKVLVNGNYNAVETPVYFDGDGADIEIPEEGDETPGDETEKPAEYKWVEVTDGVTAPAEDGWTFYANKSIDLSEYAGKTIKIAFEYISTETVCPAWEIQKVSIRLIDMLADVKDAKIAEMLEYVNQTSLATNPNAVYSINYYTRMIKEAESEEEIDEAFDYILDQLVDQVYADMNYNFTWLVDEKFVSYTESAAEGSSPWQLADFSANSMFTTERVNERVATPWSAKEGEDVATSDEVEGEGDVRESNDENAIMIQNKVSGLYLALPKTAGSVIGSTADKEEAGYLVVKPVDGVFALTDDATGLYVNVDATKGAVLSETPQALHTGELNVWDEKDAEQKIVASFPGAKYADYEWSVEEISSVEVAVSPDAKLSGFGSVTVLKVNEYTWEYDVVQKFSATALASATPVAGTGKEISFTSAPPSWEQILVETPFEANIYTLALRNVITQPGTYVIEVEEGTFVAETKDGNVYSPVISQQVSIFGEVEAESFKLVVAPAEGEVTELETIKIQGEGDICAVNNTIWNLEPEERPVITLTKGEEVVATWDAETVSKAMLENPDFLNPDSYELTLSEKITAEGTYTLTIPAEFFEGEEGSVSEETVINWTIK